MQAIAYCNEVVRIIKADNIDKNKRIEELERIRNLFTTRDRGIILRLSEFIDHRIGEAEQKPLTCVLPELIEYVYTSHCSAWLSSKHQNNNVRVPIYLKSFPPNAMDQMLRSFAGNDVGTCLLCDVAAIITLMFAWNISDGDFANQQCPLLFELSSSLVGCSGNTTFNATEIISTFRAKARPYAFEGTELVQPSDEVARIFGELVTDLSPEHHDDANTTDSEDIPDPQNIVTRSTNNDLSPSIVIKIPLLKTLKELEGHPSIVIHIPLLKTWDELKSVPNLSQTQPEQVEKTNGGTIIPKLLTSVEPSSSHVVSTCRPNSQAAQRNLLKRLDDAKIYKQRFTKIMQKANELFAKIKANDNDANNRFKLVKRINYYMHPVVFAADSSIDMLEHGITLLEKDGERLDTKIAILESQLSKM